MSILLDNLRRVRDEISAAADAAGRPQNAARLLAVSKTFPASDIIEVMKGNQIMFGENRIQELEVKVPAVPGNPEWHLIGHLQSNKAAKAVSLVSWIHSVDSAKLLDKIIKAAETENKKINILFEVNTSGEESKFGIRSCDDLLKIAEQGFKSQSVKIAGLMTMAPLGASESDLHKCFGTAREWRGRIEKEFGAELPELSMGMSGDFKTAIAEGATIVRIGTAIFGGRTYPA